MSGSIKVMGVLLPSDIPNKMLLRIRWFLTGERQDEFALPLPGDRFAVMVTDRATGTVVAQDTVAPHPLAMLDPPRHTRQALPPGPHPFLNALPDARPWLPVDPSLDDLRVDDTHTLAFGVAHLLGRSHQSYVERRLQSIASQHRLVSTQADAQALAQLFAAIYRKFPGHPRDLLRTVREGLKGDLGRIAHSTVFPWLAGGSELAALAAPVAGLAIILELIAEVGSEAAEIAGRATNIRDLVGLRATQGGEVIDYWCDYDVPFGQAGSPTCPPANQGRRVPAAEAIGIGVDLAVPSQSSGLLIAVEHVRPQAVIDDPDYCFPPDGSLGPCADGAYLISEKVLQAAATNRQPSLPIPKTDGFKAWIDYDFVSSFALPAGAAIEENLEAAMASAKHVTGDGIVSIQVRRPPSSKSFSYEYPFNVYCTWEGETSEQLRRFFDDPTLEAPTLAELRPFLVTRKYSHRRDIEGAFQDASRIEVLALLEHPPYEALIGRPDAIVDAGVAVPYPSRDASGAQAAQLTLNIRDLLPPAGLPSTVRWERQGGGRPDLLTAANVWTVERQRPGTKPGSLTQPQRFRLWVTAVDAFQQESDAIPVVAAEPGHEHEPTRFLFSPRWRTAPPPAEDLECTRAPSVLKVTWAIGPQALIGTAITDFSRLPLDADIVVMRRPITTVSKATIRSAGVAAIANEVLEREVLELEQAGWELWNARFMPNLQQESQVAEFPLQSHDAGFEYIALVAHAVPAAKVPFVQLDELQTLRYLLRGGSPGSPRFEEARWQIPSAGPPSRFRNRPRFSAHAAAKPIQVLPTAADLPVLLLKDFNARPVRAEPVLGVQALARDDLLSRIIELRDVEEPESGTLPSSQQMLLQTAIERITPPLLPEEAAGLSKLLHETFTKQSESAQKGAHPIIGFRGGLRLTWRAARQPKSVPVVQYRIYGGRMAWPPLPVAEAMLESNTLRFNGPAPQLPGHLPAMVTLSREREAGIIDAWTGLANQEQDGSVTVGGLRPTSFAATPSDPPSATLLKVSISAADRITHLVASTALQAQDYSVVVPIGGGHREIAAWWIAATDCSDKETWKDPNGLPQMFAQAFAATIMPLAPTSLGVKTPANFRDEAPDPGDFGKLAEFLPPSLPVSGLSLFPRSILTWKFDDVGETSEYLFIQRQSEREGASARATPDPAWTMLKEIQAAPVGAPWSPRYVALEPWLRGLTSPSSGDETTATPDSYFFAKEARAAWAFKDLRMQRGSTAPTFIDYFDRPPSEGGSGLLMGDTRVRYRAFKVLDLQPELPGPDVSRFDSRYLVSEPSQWTAWVTPGWPPIRITHKESLVERGNGPLVTFAARSGFVGGSLASSMRESEPLFFRVAIRREVSEAFRNTHKRVMVGKMLELPLASTMPSAAPDDSVERVEPGQSREITYDVAAELIWRPEPGLGSERVLRMFESMAAPLVVQVPGSIGKAEAALAITLNIQVG